MKIAIIAHSLHPIKEPFAGGLEMITFLLCDSLIAQGHEVHLYAHKNSDTRFNITAIDPLSYVPKKVADNSLSIDEPSTGSLAEAVGYTNVMMKIAAGNYDIIHNHSLHYIPILIGNGLNTPMITSIHTPQFDFLRLAANEVKDNCTQTFTMVSKSLAKTWNSIIPNAKVVHNGINLAMWNFVAEPSGNYLFWYGRICPEKGTDLAINAAIKCGHNIKLAGPISNREYFESNVAPLLAFDNVEYLGHLPQVELNPILGNAIALLFTSTWDEPYGLTLAESLACGTPVVALKGGATSEILTKETGIIIPKDNILFLGEAIASAQRLNRECCRIRAEEFCSHQVMVRKYLSLYDSLLEYRDYKLRRIS